MVVFNCTIKPFFWHSVRCNGRTSTGRDGAVSGMNSHHYSDGHWNGKSGSLRRSRTFSNRNNSFQNNPRKTIDPNRQNTRYPYRSCGNAGTRLWIFLNSFP
ncbi:MAG: hypothetical protein EU533_04460 [Promethearchaeota archaeon]|nr:MAG: hypothetical protein EU533_04460 [Candidatus Lokiarchaeota archaeon]